MKKQSKLKNWELKEGTWISYLMEEDWGKNWAGGGEQGLNVNPVKAWSFWNQEEFQKRSNLGI